MAEPAVGLEFDETMEGGFSLGAIDPNAGAKLGKIAGTVLTLKNHITVASVDAFVADPDHGAVLEAVIDFPPLGEGLVCDPGRFDLFQQSDDPKVKLMIYAAGFSAGGQRYFLEGRKYVRDGVAIDELLDQTTTLYTRLYEGVDTRARIVGAGVLHIGVVGAIRLVASMRTIDSPGWDESAHAIARFGAFFFGELWESYRFHWIGPSGTPPPNPSRAPLPVGFPRDVLSRPAADLDDGATATVVVIGSGYGGGIAASRLARAGQDVMVLERGSEWRSGDFPTTTLEAAAEFQVDTPDGRRGARTALYDLRVNDDVDVFVGCGLGGTSLVNANVSLKPDPAVFDDPRWPEAIRRDRDTLLADGFERALRMLAPTPYPDAAPALPKLEALGRAAAGLGRTLDRPPLNVAFAQRVNAAGVVQPACTLCGDCVTGCNRGAKTTVDMSYLPDAKAHGARIFTEVMVRWIERVDGRYRVVWRWTDADDDAALRVVTADVVVIAAGALGSTEILLRSAERGLPVSSRVGHGMSSNADYLSFAYNGDTVVDGVGRGARASEHRGPVGPTITGVIVPPPDTPLKERYVVEDGAIPGALADALPLAFSVAASTVGVNTAHGVGERIKQAGRALESLAMGTAGAYHGAVANTQMLLSMGHDDAAGSMALVDDRLRVVWPGAGDQPCYQRMQATTTDITAVAQGVSVKEPTWTEVLHHNVVTVHPLGGCPMGEDAAGGAVNERGQVFSGATGTDVHAGLYVVDGSIVPTAAGVNPLLTISALAERAMTLLIADRGWV